MTCFLRPHCCRPLLVPLGAQIQKKARAASGVRKREYTRRKHEAGRGDRGRIHTAPRQHRGPETGEEMGPRWPGVKLSQEARGHPQGTRLLKGRWRPAKTRPSKQKTEEEWTWRLGWKLFCCQGKESSSPPGFPAQESFHSTSKFMSMALPGLHPHGQSQAGITVLVVPEFMDTNLRNVVKPKV